MNKYRRAAHLVIIQMGYLCYKVRKRLCEIYIVIIEYKRQLSREERRLKREFALI